MRVRIFGTLRKFAGAPVVDVDLEPGDTVRDLLQRITAQHSGLAEKILDEEGHLQSSVNILVNGRSVKFLDGLDSTLHEDDRLALFPAVGGG
jgi:molybdopterin synthase sulfur carrier subunit